MEINILRYKSQCKATKIRLLNVTREQKTRPTPSSTNFSKIKKKKEKQNSLHKNYQRICTSFRVFLFDRQTSDFHLPLHLFQRLTAILIGREGYRRN